LIRVRHRFVTFALLALTLLVAQVGALAHGYSHLRWKGDLVGAGNAPSQICTECLSSTPLLAAGGVPESFVIFHPPCASEAPHETATSVVERHVIHAFRSRAPPRLV
jgi:hypothetical protein